MGAPLSEATRRETVRLYEAGQGLTDIGRHYGLTPQAITKRLLTAGVQPCGKTGLPPKPITEMALAVVSGKFLKDAAQDLSVSYRVFCIRLYRRGFRRDPWVALQPFSTEERDLIRQALDVDHLTFPDVIELIEDHRSAS